MARRFVLLLILGALVAPSSVQGAPFSPGLEYAYRLSLHYWGGAPANCTSIDFEIVPDDSLEDHAAGMATIPVEPEPCFLYVSRFLAKPNVWGFACGVILHEAGHLHGFEHSPDPDNVMYWTLERLPEICQRAMLFQMNHPRFTGSANIRYHSRTFNDR